MALLTSPHEAADNDPRKRQQREKPLDDRFQMASVVELADETIRAFRSQESNRDSLPLASASAYHQHQPLSSAPKHLKS